MYLKDPGRLLVDKETREDRRGLHSSWLVLYTILYLCTACLGQWRIRPLIIFKFTEQITTTADGRTSSTNNSQPLSPIHLLTQLPTNTLDKPRCGNTCWVLQTLLTIHHTSPPSPSHVLHLLKCHKREFRALWPKNFADWSTFLASK